PDRVAPSSPIAVGREHLERSRYAEAERVFRAELSGPNAAAAALGLAETLLATGRYAEAAELARTIDDSKFLEPRGALVEARALYRLGSLSEAERVLRRVEGVENALDARLLLGEVLIEQGRRKDARGPLMTLIEAYNAGRYSPEDA